MTIQEVADVNPRLKKDGIPEDLTVSFVPMPAVGAGDGTIDVSQARVFSEVKKGYTAFQEGDVLFAKITPCMENGKMTVVPKVINGYGFGSTEFHVLRPKPGISAKYLYHFISSKAFRGKAERYMTGAVGQKRVSATYLKEHSIPVAPLEQQESIVAEIEKQFSRLDEAVISLKRAKANLKRYKAAFLKAAVEGKLTEEWRKQHPDVEPATELLKRILIERRQKWEEAELAKMRAKGKEPKDDKWKARYKEPIITDTEHLQELPSEWMWVSLLTVAVKIQTGPFGSLLHKEEYVKRGVPLVNPTHISGQRILADWDLTVLPNKANSLSKYRMEMGDIVMGRRGEMGRCASVSEKQDGWLCGTGSLFIRLIPHMNSLFYSHFLSSKVIRDYLGENSIGTTMSNLNQNILRSLPIPLCSEAEQDRIMQDVNYKISIIDKLETYTSSNLQEIEILRQSILNKAFSGNLKSKYEKLITGLKTK